jgi:hypothetical protein
MGPSSLPVPPPSYVTATLPYVHQGFPGLTMGNSQPLFTPEELYPLTGVKTLLLNTSVAEGVQILDNAIKNTTSQAEPGSGPLSGPHSSLTALTFHTLGPGQPGQSNIWKDQTMSTTHLVYDSGTITVPAGLGLTQIGPNLDVRKYSEIRVVGIDFGGLIPAVLYDLQVVEGGIALPLAVGIAIGVIVGEVDRVFRVPGRELQILVEDIPLPGPANLRLLVFGLEL